MKGTEIELGGKSANCIISPLEPIFNFPPSLWFEDDRLTKTPIYLARNFSILLITMLSQIEENAILLSEVHLSSSNLRF